LLSVALVSSLAAVRGRAVLLPRTDAQREELVANIEKQLKQQRNVRTLFAVRWEVK